MDAKEPAQARRAGSSSLMGKLSIRHKLVLIIMGVSAFSMLLTGGALIVYQEFSFRERMVRDLETQAQVLGANCTAALSFDVSDDAEDVLEALRTNSPIQLGGVYRVDKSRLAQYQRADYPAEAPLSGPVGNGHSFGEGHLKVWAPVILDGQRIGAVYLQSDLTELAAFRRESLVALALTVLLSSVAAYVLSSGLQKVISGPVSELARTARAVAEGENYSIRARRSSEDELGLLTEAFNNLLAHVEKTVKLEKHLRESQKMEAVGRLAGGIAHDFNNLLQVISSHLYFVRHDVAAEDAEGISKATESAKLLTQQLLAFSRQAVMNPESLYLDQVVGEAVALVRRTLGEDIETTFEPGTGLWPIRADAGQVQQVILNLALNARDAMPGGGKLSFATRNVHRGEGDGRSELSGDYVMLSVKDTGCGMDEHTLAHAFEPFFTTKSAGRGTGLGLATVFGIVHQSGGHLDIDSEVGRGTKFQVFFPRHGEAPAKAAVPRPEAAGRAGRGEVLLLVEDEQAVREATSRVLRHAGYEVLEAEDAERARSLFDAVSGQVALLITDVVMPGRGGDELARELLRRKPRLSVLFMTGYAPRAEAVVLEGGACLQKPIDPGVLLQKIRSLLEERSAGEGEKPSGGGLLLLVEDEATIRRTTSRVLTLMGYEVVSAKDGCEGLERFEARPQDFDAVVLDWIMPGMGGEETLKKMLEIRPDLRVVITSGDSAHKARHLSAGVITFLQKPFKGDQLVAKLEEIISPAGKGTGEP